MAQRIRYDAPGRGHHVMNRGIARRVIFASREDCRQFLAALACSARRGEIHVEAVSLLGTHFHLLAWTEEGDISYPLMRVQNRYARHFNRKNRRDGPVFRGRFRSKPVRSMTYWRTVVRYIDHNPVQAGLCEHPLEYPFGSAVRYAQPRGPAWLDRARVERCVRERGAVRAYTTDAYARVFGAPLSEHERFVVERRLRSTRDLEDEFDELLRQPPAHIARWMAWKARLADNLKPWVVLASPQAVDEALDSARTRVGPLEVCRTRKRQDGWRILRFGLLHGIAGLGAEALSRRTRCSPSTATRTVRTHLELIRDDDRYRETAAVVARLAFDITFGPRPS